jgi:ABC-type lipoprotein export system ATPase subunit
VAVSFALRGLTFAYPGAVGPVLRGLTLDVPADRTIVVLGQSGSGKSTLLSLLGLLWEGRPPAGQLIYTPPDGKPLDYHTLSRGRQAELRRREFGFVLQSSYLLPHFCGFDNVAMPLYLGRQAPPARAAVRRAVARALAGAEPAGSMADRVVRLIAAVSRPDELADLCLKPAREASGGQRQRLAVLRAVVHGPRVLFADEPFSNLDPANTRAVLDLLQRWQAGDLGTADGPRTLFLVCHHLRTAFLQERDGRPLAEQFLVLTACGTLARGRLLGRAELAAEVEAAAGDYEEALERLLTDPRQEEVAGWSVGG